MRFVWDQKKASKNLAKHLVSFEEATTVFGDPLSDTYPDPAHSDTEQRFIIIGLSEQGRMLVVAHADDGEVVRLIRRVKRQLEKERHMKKVEMDDDDDLLPEYDFSQMKGSVRGKYVERYREGTNLVLLDPDVAAAFPDAKAVNAALRQLMQEKQPKHSR
jgi:uncharacterized DUF497 family protein